MKVGLNLEDFFLLGGSRKALVKVVPFQLKWDGHPQDDAIPYFYLDSKSFIPGFLNDVSFVSGSILEGIQKKQNF